MSKQELTQKIQAIKPEYNGSAYFNYGAGMVEDFKAKVIELVNNTEEYLTAEVERLKEALEDIAQTAQQASMHQPEQFCEWAFNRAEAALKGGSDV